VQSEGGGKMKQRNYAIGKLGERMACDFLIRKGYRIIKRNFQTRFGEIDLIVSKDGKLIFVEVKLKIGEDFGTPEEMISKYKIKQIEMTGETFLMQFPEYEQKFSLQIDAVCIVLSDKKEILRIAHYENITG